MLWVSRSHVHVYRVAFPWLITRFVDNQAEFLFVPTNQIKQVVKKTSATPFDAAGIEPGHVKGRRSAVQFEVYDALYAWCRLEVASKLR